MAVSAADECQDREPGRDGEVLMYANYQSGREPRDAQTARDDLTVWVRNKWPEGPDGVGAQQVAELRNKWPTWGRHPQVLLKSELQDAYFAPYVDNLPPGTQPRELDTFFAEEYGRVHPTKVCAIKDSNAFFVNYADYESARRLLTLAVLGLIWVHATASLAHGAEGKIPCTNLGCAYLGMMVPLLLMTVQWEGIVGLTRRVGQRRKGTYKARHNFALVSLLLVAQVEMVHTEAAYKCSSSSDCDFQGCNDIPCSSNSPGCVNGIWTNWQCNKYNRYTSQSCANGGCGCYFGEYDSIQLYTGVCPGRPCPEGTYGAFGDGFEAWGCAGTGWCPPSTCTPCEVGKARSFPLLLSLSPSLFPSLPLLPRPARVSEAGYVPRGSVGGVEAGASGGGGDLL